MSAFPPLRDDATAIQDDDDDAIPYVDGPSENILSATVACSTLLVSVMAVMLAHGLQGALLTWRANSEGFSTNQTGLIMSGYYMGFVAGALLAPRLVRHAGHVRVFAALASVASIAPLLHAIIIDEYVWLVLRALTGFAYSGIYIIAESWLNDRASNKMRGTLLSVYMTLNALALSMGPLLLNIASPMDFDLFIYASVFVSLAVLPMLLAASKAPEMTETDTISIFKLYTLSPLGMLGILICGMSLGALFALAPLYVAQINFSIAEASIFLSVLTFGGVVFQAPLGILSDRMDRRIVIIGANVVIVLCAALIILLPLPQWLFTGLFCILGGILFCSYGLYLSHANDRLNLSQMLAASSTLVLVNGIGAVIGPLVSSNMMTLMGPVGFPATFIILNTVIVLYGFYRMNRREAVPLEDQENVSLAANPVGLASVFSVDSYKEMVEGYNPEEDRGEGSSDNPDAQSGG